MNQRTNLVIRQAQLNNPIGILQCIVGISRDPLQPYVIEWLVGFGNRRGELGDADAGNGATRRQIGAGGGAGEGGFGRRGGGRGEVGTASFEVELEEVEERAGDEGPEEKPSAALHHALEGDDEFHAAAGEWRRRALLGFAGLRVGLSGLPGLGHWPESEWGWSVEVGLVCVVVGEPKPRGNQPTRRRRNKENKPINQCVSVFLFLFNYYFVSSYFI